MRGDDLVPGDKVVLTVKREIAKSVGRRAGVLGVEKGLGDDAVSAQHQAVGSRFPLQRETPVRGVAFHPGVFVRAPTQWTK